MKKICNLGFFLLFYFPVFLFAQKKPIEYDNAVKLAKEATLKVISGELKAADSLAKLSIETYPVLDIIKYTTELAKLSDITGANIISDKLSDRFSSFSSNKIFGILEYDYIATEYPKDRVWFNFLLQTYKINAVYGGRQQLIKSLKKLFEPNVNVDLKTYYRISSEYENQQTYKFTYAILTEDYQAAQSAINEYKSPYYKKNHRKDNQIRLFVLQKDYIKALALAKEQEAENWGTGVFYSFYIYCLTGDPKAISYFQKQAVEYPTNKFFAHNYLAVYYLKIKDYQKALEHIKIATSLRQPVVILADYQTTNWDFYKIHGDIFTGLKEFEKAKTYYNLAQLYHPKMRGLKEAMLNLENVSNLEVSKDKTQPIITITEPSPNRGLKVVSVAENVMVKGLANDISGIKEVTLNGVKTYAQNDGNFWGDVPMKIGINKIIVTAIDMAGNKAEKTFEIEKTAPASLNTGTPILAVTEKVGKNYCLLIASQNYFDTSIPSLENPIADAVKLKIVLKKNYGFEDKNIISLFNPTGNDIKRQLLELTNTIQQEDNLLIFYAGHGIWVEKEKKGYWLMTDAIFKDTNTWTPNKVILDLIAKLPSRHTLLITDACFSGSVFKTRGITGNASSAIKELDSKITRVAITSGNDTEVPDESVFMKHLINALSQNKEQYISAQKMFITQILEAVMTESKTEPRYGTLELAGHVGGDFIFSKK